jgi:hypothetical protein
LTGQVAEAVFAFRANGGATMVYRGIVKKGVIVVEDCGGLPEGTEVRIEPVVQKKIPTVEGPTLAEQFRNIIGTVPELPSDMAENHDHYLYGAMRR